MELSHSDEDQAIVEAQLGRSLRGTWEVAVRCHLGVPMVIENHPRLDDGTPFPTLFWLSCPLLVKRAGRLEASGWMAEATHALARDPGLASSFAAALSRYRERRDSHEAIEDSGSPPGGGPDRVKCLHAHIAHELADPPNPIGARGIAATGWPDCRVPCFRLEDPRVEP